MPPVKRTSRYWTCQRIRDGKRCGQRNEKIKQRCTTCGAPRPAARKPKHLVALNAPYEHYVELNGSERCALCLRPPGTRRLHRDHDHATGKPRGLLCPRCNRALPHWVTPNWLRAAADYLDRAAA